jgi:hypothetical protein
MAGFTAQEHANLKGLNKAKRNLRQIKTRFGFETVTVFRRAGLIIADSAAQIIQAKGHVVTGALWRSQTAQVINVTTRTIEVSVGSDRPYAEFIENLPDGGYLFEACEKQRAVVLRYIESEYAKVIRRSINL